MADEILTSGGGGGTALVAAVARRQALLSLGSRASLRNHPALINLGEDLIGSTTLEGTRWSLGGIDQFSTVAEGDDAANVAITNAAFTVAPARKGLAREFSDYSRMLDPTGNIDSMVLAQDAVMGAGMTLTNLLAQEIDGFTTVGSTGVGFTHSLFLSLQFALEQGLVSGPYLTVLKPKQFTDWQGDLETRGGVTQWRASTEAMQALKGEGNKGSYNTIEVFTSNQVQGANANADWAGGMFGRGAIGYKELSQGTPPKSQFVLLDVNGVIRIAEARDERAGNTVIVGHYYVGTVTIEAGRGRTAISAQ